jgi:hypothetical protein
VLYRGSSTVPVWAALAIPLCLYMSVIGAFLVLVVVTLTGKVDSDYCMQGWVFLSWYQIGQVHRHACLRSFTRV